MKIDAKEIRKAKDTPEWRAYKNGAMISDIMRTMGVSYARVKNIIDLGNTSAK